MYEVLVVIYLLVSLGLIGLVLIQQGKGADMGASFGAGASGNFLTRTTAILAIAFFTLSLLIGNLSANHAKNEDSWKNLGSDVEQVTQPVQEGTEKSETKIPD
jgi:preprotein translocase subunit SecG